MSGNTCLLNKLVVLSKRWLVIIRCSLGDKGLLDYQVSIVFVIVRQGGFKGLSHQFEMG